MLKNPIKISVVLLLTILSFTACRKNSYPCPGNGTMSERELSLFDEEGNLKAEKSKKKKKDNGLINKKKDDRLKNRRKRYLGDKPKHMKK